MGFLHALSASAGSLIGFVVPFLFVLTLVVFIHELGHFLVGRWCGVKVKAFSIGFGTELLGWTDRQGTRWRVAAIPLGGYVKFAGDAGAASTPDYDEISHMSAEERRGSFYHKSIPRRAAIVAAGPIANFLLAIAIFSGSVFIGGRYLLTPRVAQVQQGSAAEAAGFKAGDVVVAIEGTPIEGFADIQRIVSARPGEKLDFVVERGGVKVPLEAVPRLKTIKTPFGTQKIGVIGLMASQDQADWKLVRYGLLDSLKFGLTDTWYVVDRTADYVSKLVRGKESTDQLSGPIRIAQVSEKVASTSGFAGLLNLAAVLSVSIGLVNLFPIPLLDGGHLMFYALEALRGRPLSERAQEIGFRIGLAIVVMLMLFVTWNDLVHLGASFGLKGT